MTYQQTLDWMFAQLPMYQDKGRKALNAKLDNIRALAAQLGNPQSRFKSIHVAGTNGKGSSSHMLASILQEAGYKVGLYTSPHLKDFRERIKINGVPAEKEFVIRFIKTHRPFLERRKLSFFEMTVGMAFHYFAENKVDVAVIEVGLGGRLDATNIIFPEVALITNIGMDHTETLGSTLAEITREKAGIIKEGIPVVISEKQQEISGLFEAIAQKRNAKLFYADETVKKSFQTDLLGKYQAKNVKGVIATISQLEGFEISEKHILAGLTSVVRNTGLMGRWQVLQSDPLVVCDTAHNTEGVALVVEQIRQQTYKTLHIVLGFVVEKNLEQILPLLPREASYYLCKPDIRRGLEAGVLAEKAAAAGLRGEVFPSVMEAYQAALSRAVPEDFVFVGGSTFTVAEVL